jgi:RNase adaptor protein for sRNA GlmZ degradation
MAQDWRVHAVVYFCGAVDDLLGAVLYWHLGLEFADMTKDEALKLALEALQKDVRFYKTEKLAAITAIREALAQPVQEAAAFIAAEDKKVASRYGYVPKLHPSEWQDVQPEERNFCQRCGKRTADLTTIHTCTPPLQPTIREW